MTHGARGLGWNMAQALAEAGAEAIAILDVKEELGETAASELQSSAKIPVKFYKADVTDAEANDRTVERIVSDLGSVDILVNSAGIVECASLPPFLSFENPSSNPYQALI
ncbi:MAG: hypothetical protein LQ352_006677 [Teloschistes flavicans]|nr:MAG: hypothetical protein LQ352_006677 [Teloschistes flavicans]